MERNGLCSLQIPQSFSSEHSTYPMKSLYTKPRFFPSTKGTKVTKTREIFVYLRGSIPVLFRRVRVRFVVARFIALAIKRRTTTSLAYFHLSVRQRQMNNSLEWAAIIVDVKPAVTSAPT